MKAETILKKYLMASALINVVSLNVNLISSLMINKVFELGDDLDYWNLASQQALATGTLCAQVGLFAYTYRQVKEKNKPAENADMEAIQDKAPPV